jgi:hypothetical protein
MLWIDPIARCMCRAVAMEQASRETLKSAKLAAKSYRRQPLYVSVVARPLFIGADWCRVLFVHRTVPGTQGYEAQPRMVPLSRRCQKKPGAKGRGWKAPLVEARWRVRPAMHHCR